ncbi:lysine histidine transporter-like 7 [Dorcoceras hygrometricum]|uniref:Lysine histidine transporter-like 7 n=1 Tax=Dorcoceras hygrometricum TaxID=472368 RepID=A0A2Z7BWA0_9LAMI|nr:lysine histidine transporter-like 7 [Dorcoceras hygrometricum]
MRVVAPCIDTIFSPFVLLAPATMAKAPSDRPPPGPAGSIGTIHGPSREPQPTSETLEGGSPLTEFLGVTAAVKGDATDNNQFKAQANENLHNHKQSSS